MREHMFTFVRSICAKFPDMGRPLRFLIVSGFALLALVLVVWLGNHIVIFFLSRSYVDHLAVALDVNKNLATAIFWGTFAVAVLFGSYTISFSRRRRLLGLGGLLILLIGHSLILWLGTSGHFFERSGKPIKCYTVARDTIQYGEQPGIDPVSGRECRPVTPEIVERLNAYARGARPHRLESSEPVFFEPRTGAPIVWYAAGANGQIELFDLMGFHPETGEELLPVNREIVQRWKGQQEERLQREARRAPQRIDPDKYSPFDPVTGQARVWYWRYEQGGLEFYDRPGFHQTTGERLEIITREIIDAWREEQKKAETDPPRIPQRVDLDQYAPFDPLTGIPRAWYWRSDKGDYEFFDSAGFHPNTGEPLNTLTREAIKKRDEEIQQRKSEAQKKAELDRKRAEQEEQDRIKREAEREREAQAAKLCDQLAGNPNDPRRAAEGASYEVLRSHAKKAAEHCELAVKRPPSELRFQYQLARALESVDGQKAFELQKRLVELKYPAAFDNAGSLYIRQEGNYAQAAKLFRMGSQLGDPDSMMSLAELIEKGYAAPSNANETPPALYARAAQLGHPRAQEKFEAGWENA